MAKEDFRSALTKLATDQTFRTSAISNPETIENTFSLSITELQALRDAAVMSGADMSAVDALRGLRIQERARGQLSPSLANGTSVSCCSCCCCCCGETAVISA
jgi:hypothetical protein